MLHVIGTVTLNETHDFEDRGFQTASSRETVRCEAGQTVPLVYNDDSTGFVSFGFEGVVIDGYHANSLGAHSIAVPTDQFVGRTRTFALSPYAYQLHGIMANPLFTVRLAPGVKVELETRIVGEGTDHAFVSTYSRIIPAPRRFNRKLDTGMVGHDTRWLIVDAEGEPVETIVEPSYTNGRETDRRIIRLEMGALNALRFGAV